MSWTSVPTSAVPILAAMVFCCYSVLAGAGCDEPAPLPDAVDVGNFELRVDRDGGTFSLTHRTRGDRLRDVRLASGTGSATIEMGFGSFKFEDLELDVTEAASIDALTVDSATTTTLSLLDGAGESLGALEVIANGDDTLRMRFTPADGAADRLVLEAACDADDHFLGLGSHAMDLDHVGQSFPLWVSEPGIGKSTSDEYPDDWFFTGTRHASSFPVPFLLRPHQAHGLLVDTRARVAVDLCDSDAERFSVEVWDGAPQLWLFSGDGPLDVVRQLALLTGQNELSPPWVFGPWNDAVRGPERVREVAAALRAADAPSTVIWTEDWKGAHQTAYGYHLTMEWFLDPEFYPDAVALADELEAQGFKWFAYFAPFLEPDTETYDRALAADAVIRDAAGDPYLFTGVTFTDNTMVDITTNAGWDFVVEHVEAAIDIGFDGWMADYAEWLPTDAVLASGEDALAYHNHYAERWKQLHRTIIEGRDLSFFSRSGWWGAEDTAPVIWAGDQRTSFDADDGLPTIIPLGLGLSACGIPVFSHDVAGYQSQGNPTSDKELWFRWAELGAFSPVMRTHHGASDDQNWQFDSDAETTAHWAALAREHMRLFPYRYGLAARAVADGTPMLLPTSFLFEGEDWGRMDVWMLGEALLVAPVLERDARSREVALPAGVDWYDWWTRTPATGGTVDAPLDHIPVFAAAGTTVPTFATAPDTLLDDVDAGLTTLADVDGERVVYLFGGGGSFTEADGTAYAVSGEASGPAEQQATLTSGEVQVGGVTVTIDGTRERTYTLVVVD